MIKIHDIIKIDCSPYIIDGINMNYHLYILSDKQPKLGEYHYYENEIILTTEDTIQYMQSSGDNNLKKIIATTDELYNYKFIDNVISNNDLRRVIKNKIPQIPLTYIEKYIESDENINTVEIEYEPTVEIINKYNNKDNNVIGVAAKNIKTNNYVPLIDKNNYIKIK